MNRQCYCIIVLLLIHLHSFSQKEANIWYFGQNAGLDFNTNPPSALTNGLISTNEGCSSFSDASGNLLFYSDGISVYSRNHQLMTYSNGNLANDLKGNPSSTQSGMIIPKPGSTDIYYLFTVGTDFVPTGGTQNPGFNYYEIDLSKNAGLGEITDGPINLAIDPITNLDLSSSWSEKVTAVKGKDCNTFWVLSFVGSTFYAYKVNEFGVDINNVVLSTVNFSSNDKRGYLQVSPDGTKIAFADFNAVQGINGSLVLFDFDSQTGMVDATTSETLIRPGSNEAPYGVAFSQQSNKLYATVYGNQFTVYQFDLESSDIAQSKQLITRKSGYRGALQLGPDGKIYVSVPDQQYLDVIENPNYDADDIIYSENSIYLGGRFATQGLPPFLASLLLPIEITDITNNQIINNEDLQYCVGESITIQPETITGTNINYTWVFNDGITSTVIANTPDLTLSNLSSLNDGTYELTVTLEDDCGNKTTLEGTFNMSVFDLATANKPQDINFCDTDDDGFNTFDFQNDITPIVLGTQDPATFDVSFFLSLSDAENNVVANALNNPYTNTTAFDTHDIYVRIHNSKAIDACYDITQFNLTISVKPNPSQPDDYLVCDDDLNGGDTDGYYNNFLLSSKDNEILGGLSASDYNITYHTSLIGAQTDGLTDVIDKNVPYRNVLINEETIYIRIENSKNTNCYLVSEESSTLFKPFKLILAPLPVVNNNIQFVQCDTDTDLSTKINLELTQSNISTNYNNEIFKYYTSEANAIADVSEIAGVNNYTANDGDIIWVKTISAEECYRISQIEISVYFSGNINYTNEFKQCDDLLDIDGNDTDSNNDEDGITFFDLSSVTTDVKNLFPVATQNDLEILIFESIDDRNLLNNPIIDLANYRNANIPAFTPQPLYIKVINKNDSSCEGIGEFTILSEAIPKFEIESPQLLCLNNPPLTLEVKNNANFNYFWAKKDNPTVILSNTYQLDVYEEGEYNITISDNTTAFSCGYTQTTEVIASSTATVDANAITIVDDSSNNSITIDTTNLGDGDYEFALFNDTETVRSYQTQPYFENLPGGIYTVSIKDTFNCGFPAEIEVSVVEFPKFLTPNNDGYNDTWSVKGINTNFYPNSSIIIFDRFGKKIAEIEIEGDGWDGLHNGKTLPSNDYWYSIQLIDTNGNIRNRKGHFSLLRK